VLIPIVECGEHSILYTIPSFSVITVRLRPISYQGYGTDEQVKLVDGFMWNDPSLQEHTFTTQIMDQLHSSKACLVEVRSFETRLRAHAGRPVEVSGEAILEGEKITALLSSTWGYIRWVYKWCHTPSFSTVYLFMQEGHVGYESAIKQFFHFLPINT